MLFEKIGIIDENFRYVKDMYVGTEDDRITYISSEEPDAAVRARLGEAYNGNMKVLMPGFVNSHAHSPMNLLRGYGEGLPLERWLNEKIFPFEAHMYADGVYWATLLGMAESAKYGIVSTTDMYLLADDIVRAVSDSGLKMNISRAVTNFQGDTPEDNPILQGMKDVVLKYRSIDNGRILADAGIHAEYSNDEATLKAAADFAREMGVNMQVHVSETESETRGCMERHGGMTPTEYLDSLGVFEVPTTAAHCIWLTDNDRDILRNKGVTVAVNPVSNLKLVSGICDIDRLYKNDINVAIGTDGCSSNNNLNFLEEIKLTALLGKISSGDAAAMDPADVLFSATRAGAVSQGRRDCGLIKEGYKADLTVIDLAVPNMQPEHDVLTNMVFAADSSDIRLTMCDGRIVFRDGEYTTIDIERAIYEANRAKDRILSML